MSAEPAARLLDVTRLVSRVGRGPLTGVDRVEAAYLERLRHEPLPLYLLCRTSYGFLLLRGEEAGYLLAAFSAPETLPRPGWLDRLRGKTGRRAQLEAGLRARAVARAPHRGLSALVARHLPQPVAYVNVGQTSVRADTLRRLKRVPGLRVAAMVHDTIPLDFPQFASPGEPARFRAAFEALMRMADLVICNSQATAADVTRHAGGAAAPLLVAHLGIDPPRPDAAQIPPTLDLMPGYFVVLGTIEPRKNHQVLLDAWEDLLTRAPETEVPRLLIVGRRGWRNEALFHRLDHAPYMGRVVHECPGLPDAAVAALVQGARALLMPSLAEGYGLPLLEAAALGTPVIATALPVTRELLGDSAIYADPGNRYDWADKITELAKAEAAGHGAVGARSSEIVIPTWTDHFNLVLKKT